MTKAEGIAPVVQPEGHLPRIADAKSPGTHAPAGVHGSHYGVSAYARQVGERSYVIPIAALTA